MRKMTNKSFKDRISNLKNKKIKIKFSKYKRANLIIFLIENYFCDKNLKKLFERIVLRKFPCRYIHQNHRIQIFDLRYLKLYIKTQRLIHKIRL